MKKLKNAVHSAIVFLLMAAILVGCAQGGSAGTSGETAVATETQATTVSNETDTIQSGELTEEELLEFEKLFTLPGSGWYAFALLSWYDCPEDVDLSILFLNGLQDVDTGSDEEKLVLQSVKEQKGEQEAEKWADMEIKKISRVAMDQVLKTFFGLSLEQTNGIGLNSMVYLEETDSYYRPLIMDPVVLSAEFSRGYRAEDGKIVLHYQHFAREKKVVTLVETPEGASMRYHVFSNVPADPEIGFTTPEHEGFVPDKTAQSAEEFFSMLRELESDPEQRYYSVAYQDLTYIRYRPEDTSLYTSQLWYPDKLLLGPDCWYNWPDRSYDYTNCYTVTYKNAEALAFINVLDYGGSCNFRIQVVDTNGNVVFDDVSHEIPTLDEKTATLSYGIFGGSPYFDECVLKHHTLSLKKSVDGEPMIKVTAAPDNADLSFYEDY